MITFHRVSQGSIRQMTKAPVILLGGLLTVSMLSCAGNRSDGLSPGVEPEQSHYPVIKARNPNIWADVPDMAVIRVGDSYYMSSTTMHMNPGVPIMKSTDLVNWAVIGYAHAALDSNSDALNLSGDNAYGKGTWASSISYKNGTFYVTSFSYTTNKTYIWRTDDIEGGDWTQNILPDLYHDASLLFDDDGRVYLAYGHGDIRIIELTEDLSAIKSEGIDQQIIANAERVAGSSFILAAEGTHIQKINGWYYVSNICWPTDKPRTQIVHRSRSLTGPYEGRIVLQDQGVAQGQYVSTPEGQWYLYAFRDSGAVGRIPWLVPASWQDDWPVVGINGRAQRTLGFNVADKGIGGIVRSDGFDSSDLDLVWQWNHNPDPEGWSLTDHPGFLRITNTRIDDSFVDTRNTLTQRMFGPTSSARIALDLSGMKDGDTAGLGALQSKYGFVGVVQHGTRRSVVMVNAAGDTPQEIARIPFDASYIYLRVDGNFHEQIDKATFYYSADGSSWNQIGNTLDMEYLLTHFMGYRFALFNYGTKATGGYVDFDYFHVAP